MKKGIYLNIILMLIFANSIFINSFCDKKEKIITRTYLKEANLKINSKNYFIDNKLIKPVILKTPKKDFAKSFQTTIGVLNIVCNNDTDYIGTDCLLQTKENEKITSEYNVVVYGDVTGDGLGTITDIVKMMNYVEKKEGLETDARKESVDIDGDEQITFSDIEIYGLHFQENKEISLPNSSQVETEIEISETEVIIEKNSNKQLYATTNKGDTEIVKWESNNPDIATVDETGLIAGISNGQVLITATASDQTTKDAIINVKTSVTGITIDKNTALIEVGESTDLIATISPSDATEKAVTWTSKNPDIAIVNDEGRIIAVAPGETEIIATTKDGNLTAFCTITVAPNVSSISLSGTTIKEGEKAKLNAIVNPSNAINKELVWSSKDESIATVEQNGLVTGISGGSTTITASTKNGKVSKSVKVNVEMITKVDFRNIDNCDTGRIISSTVGSDGSSATLHACVENYNFHKKYGFIQNFAITKDYVYFITPYNGAWTYPKNIEKNGEEAEFKKIAANYVVRISRMDNTYQIMYVEYAGHGQSFDVADKKITSSQSDTIYMNAFAYLYDTILNEIYRYGARYRGVSYTSFRKNYNKNGEERIPGVSIAISSDASYLGMLKSSDYKPNGIFNSQSYYNDVITVGKNNYYIVNPEVAVDEKNNRIAFVATNDVIIYDLSSFKKGIPKILNVFTKTGGKQGVELYGNYLYQWGDGTTGHKVLRKYNIKTGALVNTLDFNISEFYAQKGITGYEAEGISIHDGKVYVVVSGWDKSVSPKKGCNDLLLISGA